MVRMWSRSVAMVATVLLLAGCASNAPRLSAAEANRAAEQGYLLGAGDHLRITVFGEEKLNGEYVVADNGTVAFPLIGTVAAKGLSTDAVATAITTKLADGFLSNPRTSVEVINYRPFYILGEVSHPGVFPYASGMTVEQAVATAGGFTYRANRHTLFVTRAGQKGEHSVELNGQTIFILPGDTIRVGERYF